jgi:hypothetical protein
VKRADAICTAWADAAGPTARPRSYAAVVTYVKRTLPLYEAALRKLEALDPPSGDAQTVHAWLAADRRVAAAIRELGTAAERRDFPSVSAAASRMELAGSAGRRAARELGLHVCGRFSAR